MATGAPARPVRPHAKPARPAVKQDKTFVWQGTDKKGRRLKGESVAASEAFVRAQLRKQGINPISVRQQFALFKKRKQKIKAGDIAIFSRQLATMMKAGVPLVQSMEMIARGHENPSLRELVNTIKADIESGLPLHQGLRRHPVHFDSLYTNLVEAGEKSGALETILDKIATYKEKTEALKAKIKKALFYPTAVIIVAIIVTGILLYFVVPQFQSVFKGFGADLPAFTLFVIGLSEWTQTYWWLGALIIGGAAVTFYQLRLRSAAFRRVLDRLSLKLPVVGDILYKAAVARFARTLSTMFAAGVPLVEAMESVAKASGNIIFEEAIFKMRDLVSTGLQLQVAMTQSALFPPMATQMVGIGEESGQLDNMCAKVADFYEAEVDNLVDALSSLLEPMIMAILGVLVGGLVIAMYLPIFKLGSVI